MKAAAVNFKTEYADKKTNIEKMTEYIASAAEENADIIVFPELCTTGYSVFMSDMPDKEKAELCEKASGKTVSAIASACYKNGIYAAFGFAEHKDDRFYSSAAVISPNKNIDIYRKIHIFGEEGRFFKRGKKPLVIDTPWGKTGIGICYDTYCCPELLRYCASRGAKLYLNPTAISLENDSEGAKDSFYSYYSTTISYNIINTGMFVVSANLVGKDGNRLFSGASLVSGPADDGFKRNAAHCYAGGKGNEKEGIIYADIDLNMCSPVLFTPNAAGKVDFRPHIYAKWYGELE